MITNSQDRSRRKHIAEPPAGRRPAGILDRKSSKMLIKPIENNHFGSFLGHPSRTTMTTSEPGPGPDLGSRAGRTWLGGYLNTCKFKGNAYKTNRK